MHRWISKNNYILIFSLLSILTFVTLYFSRSLDDNRLTSWQWTFEGIKLTVMIFVLIPGVLSAYILSRFSFIERYPVISLFLFSYLIAALFWREPEVIVDASRYFTQAKHLEVYGVGYFIREWGNTIAAWTDMPLLPFLYGMIFKLFGESRLYIQIFTTSLFSMTAVFTYLIGKELWDGDTGLYGGVFLMGIPYLYVQVPLMLVDVPAMFFLALSVFLLIRALDRGGALMIVCASLTIVLAVFSKYSTWLMMSVLVIVFFVRSIRNPRAVYRGTLIILIAGVLTGAVFLYKFDIFSNQIKLLISYQKPGLKRWGESFISTFFFQIHPFITAFAVYSVYAALRKRDIKYLIVVWLVFLILALSIKRIRYIIMIFPMLSLVASYGLMQAKDKEVIRFIAMCVVVFSVITAVFFYLPFMQKMSAVNLRDAGEFLNSIKGVDVEVFTALPAEHVVNQAVSVPILDLFTNKRINYRYDPAVASGISQAEVQKSSLRFTWEYRNPEYYFLPDNQDKRYSALVLISDKADEKMPKYMKQEIKNFHAVRSFETSENIFSYRTFVTVCY